MLAALYISSPFAPHTKCLIKRPALTLAVLPVVVNYLVIGYSTCKADANQLAGKYNTGRQWKGTR